MNQTSKLINTKPVKPQRITARQQRKLLCVIEMQEREWLSIDEVDLDGYGGSRFERILGGYTSGSKHIWHTNIK